jgi:hypothetical protein
MARKEKVESDTQERSERVRRGKDAAADGQEEEACVHMIKSEKRQQ